MSLNPTTTLTTEHVRYNGSVGYCALGHVNFHFDFANQIFVVTKQLTYGLDKALTNIVLCGRIRRYFEERISFFDKVLEQFTTGKKEKTP